MNSPIRGGLIKKKNTIWHKIRKRGGVEISTIIILDDTRNQSSKGEVLSHREE